MTTKTASRVPARPTPASKQTPESSQTPNEPKDGLREIVETIVFVVVLVLLLKTFVAEAFVIPTGSMATTLLGYHADVTCPECGHFFTVNRSVELSDHGEPGILVGATCPNCRHGISFESSKQRGIQP